ncbi:Ig-like domain-containing protein [Candidatus Nitrosocosmicus sp. T]
MNKNFILVFVLVLSATVYVNYSAWISVHAQNSGPQNGDENPIISVPDSPVVSEATGPEGSLVSYTVSATNATGSPLEATCTPQSDTIFALGTTKVDCTAVDEAGNDAEASFDVLVEDTTPPTTELGISKTDWMGIIINDDFTISDDIGFAFTGSDLVGVKGFECKLDDSNWRPSTVDYQGNDKSGCYYLDLEAGPHTFQVRAVDTSNNKDSNPPSLAWTIIPLENSIINLRDFVSTIIMPPNLQEELSDSLNNAIGNIQDDGSYDHLICEYLDSFSYSFSKASVLDLFDQDVTNFVDNSFTAIRDRTGCNPPVISLENEITIDEGLNGVILDASGSFDSKDGNSLTYEWSQIAGLRVDLFDIFKSKASFNAPLLEGTSNQVIVFKVKVTDKNGLSSEKSIKVTIQNLLPFNQPPVAEKQSVTANTADPTEITLKATDPQGNALTYAIVSEPQSGTITDLNEETGSLVYTSDAGFTGQDSFTFNANDGTVDSNTATVTITVNQVNQPPVAEKQSVTANTADPTEITLKATDPQGNALTYAIVSEPQSGTITDLNEETGSLVYTSDAGFTGQDSFTFNANDGTVDSNTATVTITVNQVNQPPVAEKQSVTANTADPTEITLKATDPQGNALTYAIVSEPQSGTITDLNEETGSLVYTSDAGFTGQDSFTFNANDGTVDSNTATVTITVNQVNQPPVAEKQSVTANTADPTEITLKATDPQGNALTYAIVSEPQSGTITDLNEETGSLVYTSDAGFTGQDSFTFNANDGTVDSNTATVTITVNQVNQPPVAEKQSVTANTADPTEITLKATDPQGNALTYAIVSEPQSGTITDLNEETGSLVYTSDAGFTGQDSFTFNANDGTVDSNTATVTITVNAVEPPAEPESEDEPDTSNSGEDNTPPASNDEDNTPPPPASPRSSNNTNSSNTGLFSDGFPGFEDNMRNLFGN